MENTNKLPTNWVIDTEKEKDSPLMQKFMEWFEENRTETGVGNIYGKTGHRLSNWFGIFEQELITLEQWNEAYFPEWKPKQGERVLVRDEECESWEQRVFVCFYKGKYFVEDSYDLELLNGWNFAKQIPDESRPQKKIGELKAEAEKLDLKIEIIIS